MITTDKLYFFTYESEIVNIFLVRFLVTVASSNIDLLLYYCNSLEVGVTRLRPFLSCDRFLSDAFHFHLVACFFRLRTSLFHRTFLLILFHSQTVADGVYLDDLIKDYHFVHPTARLCNPRQLPSAHTLMCSV